MTAAMDALLQDHLTKMKAISDRGLRQNEKWAGLSVKMVDLYGDPQSRVAGVLREEVVEALESTKTPSEPV